MVYQQAYDLIKAHQVRDAVDILMDQGLGPLNIYEARITNFQSRLNDLDQAEIDGLTHRENINDIRASILKFLDFVKNKQLSEDKINELVNSLLLIDCGVPFIDRTGFRGKLKDILNSEKPQIICIEGAHRSGMSHLEYFLQHLNDALDIFNFIPLDIPEILDEPDTLGGELLAKIIAFEFDIEVDFATDEKDLFKFTQFVSALKSKVLEDDKVPLFFLHDFHHFEKRNDNLYDFISLLINKLRTNFPRSIVMFAGIDYESLTKWRKLRNYVTVYKMEKSAQADVERCLNEIYNVYTDRIKVMLKEVHDPISAQQYVTYMLELLKENNDDLQIDLLGEKLEDHIYAIKNP